MIQSIKKRFVGAAASLNLRLNPRLTLLTIAGVAVLLAVAVVCYLWRDQDAMRPLYGASEAYPAAEVMAVLDAEQIAYQLHPQSGQVLVPDSELAHARMLLSAKGVKVAVPIGYDLFDKDEPLGTSQFVQNVRLKRSLEGELAQTIMSLKGVEAARVHLALQESNSFVINHRDPAKASVMLQMKTGYKLKPEQAVAVANLVANSVPWLESKAVSIVDQYGALLSHDIDNANGSIQAWQAVDDYQQKAVANIEQVLAPILGNGNYRISVSADIDFSQKEETTQAFGDTPRLRNEVLHDESVLDQLAIGVPGSLSNLPAPIPGPGAVVAPKPKENKAATSLRKESTRKLDYDQSVTHVKHSAFNLRSQSIAVVLNASSTEDGGWPAPARAELEAMLKSAVGFNAARGDLLTLSVFPFVAIASSSVELLWWQDEKLYDLLKLAISGLVSLLLLLLVVRPALGQLSRRLSSELVSDDIEVSPLLSGEAESSLPLGKKEGNSVNLLGEYNPLSEILLPAPDSGLELQVEHLQMLAKNDPERVSEVIKQWIGRNESTLNPSN